MKNNGQRGGQDGEEETTLSASSISAMFIDYLNNLYKEYQILKTLKIIILISFNFNVFCIKKEPFIQDG